MEAKRLSITLQKAKGTYQRNQQMRKLFFDGASYAEIGRWFNLTRQAVRKIINEVGT